MLLLSGQGGCARIILVLHECIWNVTMVLLVLSAFNDTDFLGYPPGSTLGDCLPFPCEE